MPRAAVNGISLYYKAHGKGEPLVLIAGMGADHRSWFSQIGPFGKYYTGESWNPQTCTMECDRHVALLCDGASLSYEKYNQSRILTWIGEGAFADNPDESFVLAQDALIRNYFNRRGWRLLTAHIRRGAVSQKVEIKWFNEMVRVMKDHPDVTFECLNDFLQCIPPR